MKYLYSSKSCPRCTMLKARYAQDGIEFEERDADRIKAPQDDIDREALIEGSLGNLELPIVVEWPVEYIGIRSDESDPTRYGLS